jgi:hypothetical protein
MSNGHKCHVVKRLLAVPFEFREQVGDHGEPLDEPGPASEFIGGVADLETFGRILADRIALFQVEEGNELAAAAQLRSSGIPAAPIHVFGRMNHISKMPGTSPSNPFTQETPPVLAASSRGRAVAVIDSGVTETMPEWLASSVDYDPNFDVEVLPTGGKNTVSASHGVFVAGLIRRIAPEHTIYMSRTEEKPTSLITGADDPEHLEGDDPTTELDVAIAMIRVVDRLMSNHGVEVNALNLSLGGETCGDTDPSMVVLSDAIDYWVRHFPRAPIFAAGGNRKDPDPVYPAALNHVRAVAAADSNGDQVVWDLKGNEKSPPDRPWISDVAPGSKLTSPSGREPDEWVEWSGSSFACAVGSACSASRRESETAGALVYWPDRGVRASDIPGL